MPDLRTELDLVRHHRLLDPADVEVGDAASELEGVGSVPGHPGIQHDVDVRTGSVTQCLGQLDVARHSLAAISRPPAREPFQSAESFGHLLASPLVSELGFDAVAEHGGVSRSRRPHRAAEEAVDGLLHPAALEIPERAIDGADGHHRGALATVNCLAVHQVPNTLRGQGINVLEETSKFTIDDPGHFVRDRTGQTGDTLVGVDLEKDGDDPGASRLDRLWHPIAVGRGPRLVLGVDVDRPRQTFFPEWLLVLHDAGKLPQTQTRYPHVYPLPADSLDFRQPSRSFRLPRRVMVAVSVWAVYTALTFLAPRRRAGVRGVRRRGARFAGNPTDRMQLTYHRSLQQNSVVDKADNSGRI